MQHTLAILAILLSLAFLGEGIHRWNRCRVAKSWPTVSGMVVSNELRAVSGVSDEPQFAQVEYHVHLVYTYEVGGRSYTNDRSRFIPIPVAQSVAASRARRHPVGSSIRVYYDRRRPAESLLDPGGELEGLALAAGGFAGLVGSVYRFQQLLRSTGRRHAPHSPTA